MPRSLIEGLRRFSHGHFPLYRAHYERLAREGQRPSTLFLGCADSRVVPNLLTDSLPGEIFVVRNVGNLVPPFEPDEGFHGTSAGIEFAVLHLGVRDIVVCGHSHCGAMEALFSPPAEETPHITRWLELARDARVDGPASPEALRQTELRSVVIQVGRLLSYPAVARRVEAGTLALHGWHYTIETGIVRAVDLASGEFVPLND